VSDFSLSYGGWGGVGGGQDRAISVPLGIQRCSVAVQWKDSCSRWVFR